MKRRSSRLRWNHFLLLVVGVLAAFARPLHAQAIVVDNVDPGFTILSGSWNTGSFPTPWGADYRWVLTHSVVSAEVEWRPDLPAGGDYFVETWYVAGTNRADNAPFDVHHAGGTTGVIVNQQAGDSQWNALGTFAFDAGTGGSVSLANNANPSVVIADAVRFTPQGAGAIEEFRGMWLTRFEWPNTNLILLQSNLINSLNS